MIEAITANELGINVRCSTCGEAVELRIKPDQDTGQPVWWLSLCEKCEEDREERIDELANELNDLKNEIDEFNFYG